MTRPTMYFGFFGLLLLGADRLLFHVRRIRFRRRAARKAPASRPPRSCCGCSSSHSSLTSRCAATTSRTRRSRDSIAPHVRAIFGLLRLGVPMGVSVLMEASLFVATALLIGSLGADVVAGHQIAINVASVAFMLPLGMAMATTVRVGLRRRPRRCASACATPVTSASPTCLVTQAFSCVVDGAVAACDLAPLHRRCERRVHLRAAAAARGDLPVFRRHPGHRERRAARTQRHHHPDDHHHRRLLGHRHAGRLVARVPARHGRARHVDRTDRRLERGCRPAFQPLRDAHATPCDPPSLSSRAAGRGIGYAQTPNRRKLPWRNGSTGGSSDSSSGCGR